MRRGMKMTGENASLLGSHNYVENGQQKQTCRSQVYERVISFLIRNEDVK